MIAKEIEQAAGVMGVLLGGRHAIAEKWVATPENESCEVHAYGRSVVDSRVGPQVRLKSRRNYLAHDRAVVRALAEPVVFVYGRGFAITLAAIRPWLVDSGRAWWGGTAAMNLGSLGSQLHVRKQRRWWGWALTAAGTRHLDGPLRIRNEI